MDFVVPAIFTPRQPPRVLGGWARLGMLAVAVGCLAVLVTATRLEPDPSGMGTHTQLGQRPCGFLVRTGIPCGTCGMTTSFAHFVRGNVAASFRVQPMGFLLATLAGMGVWVFAYMACTGRPVLKTLGRVPRLYAVGVPVAWFVLAWGWTIGSRQWAVGSGQ